MLDIQNLSVHFSSYSKGLKRKSICAIRSLDLAVNAGQVVAVVGQSGTGKSLLAHAVLGILPGNASVSGDIFFKNSRLTAESAKRFRGRDIALIPQSVAFLNPLLHVGAQIARAGLLSGIPSREVKKVAHQALRRYGLASHVYRWLPFQLSGGMSRRVLTATATVGSASLLLADEPTNGLDVRTARETLRQLRDLADAGKAVVLITHDLEAALQMADKVSVFCGGVTIEEASASDFNGTGRLRHPYTKALWASLPNNRFTEVANAKGFRSLNGGCPFSPRCEQGDGDCRQRMPELMTLREGKVRCWHACG